MSDPNRPWGPHGPVVPANSVTPNPTPGWQEPSGGASGGQQQTAPSGGPSLLMWYIFGRNRKTIWLAVPLAWFLGPLGLLYAIGDSKPQRIALGIFMVVAILAHVAPGAPINPRFHPILLTCAIWSIFAARAYNERHKNEAP